MDDVCVCFLMMPEEYPHYIPVIRSGIRENIALSLNKKPTIRSEMYTIFTVYFFIIYSIIKLFCMYLFFYVHSKRFLGEIQVIKTE